jgi:hypothetical protein
MNVPVIEMKPDDAAAKHEEYAAALKKSYPDTTDGRRQRALDEAAELGFAALAAGKRVLNVHTALSYANLFQEGPHQGLPRLAIARADANRVNYRFMNDRAEFTSQWESNWGNRKRAETSFRSFSSLIWNFQEAVRPFNGRRWQYTAIVPTIPPGVRPRYARLAHHLILWEADWERAPRDPYLLKYLAGHMYTIEAEWDLTDLERGLLDNAALRAR